MTTGYPFQIKNRAYHITLRCAVYLQSTYTRVPRGRITVIQNRRCCTLVIPQQTNKNIIYHIIKIIRNYNMTCKIFSLSRIYKAANVSIGVEYARVSVNIRRHIVST